MLVFWLQIVNILGVLSVGTFEKENILCGGYMAGACGRNLRTCKYVADEILNLLRWCTCSALCKM